MVQSAPPPQPVRELPIAETIGEAYRSVLGNFGAWFRIMLAPAALAVPLAMLSHVLLQAEQMKLAESDLEGPEAAFAFLQAAWPEMLLGNLLSLIPYVFFAVAWHRFLLLGERLTSPLVSIWPTARHFRFYLYTLLLFVIVALAGLFVGLIGALVAAVVSGGGPGLMQVVLSFAIFMLTLYVAARLQFAFPAMAVDEHYGFLDSWRNTRGQGWRFLFVLCCCLFPPTFFYLFMALLLSAGPGITLLSVINSFVLAGVGFLTTAVVVSAISCAFRTCTGWIPPQAPTTPANV